VAIQIDGRRIFISLPLKVSGSTKVISLSAFGNQVIASGPNFRSRAEIPAATLCRVVRPIIEIRAGQIVCVSVRIFLRTFSIDDLEAIFRQVVLAGSWQYNGTFAQNMLQTILSDSNHPLRFLVNRSTENWVARNHLSEDPAIQVGHLTSLHTGPPERLAIEDAEYNQKASWIGERQRGIFEKAAINIRDVTVELETARLYERCELLPAGTVAESNPDPGWSPHIDDAPNQEGALFKLGPGEDPYSHPSGAVHSNLSLPVGEAVSSGGLILGGGLVAGGALAATGGVDGLLAIAAVGAIAVAATAGISDSGAFAPERGERQDLVREGKYESSGHHASASMSTDPSVAYDDAFQGNLIFGRQT
jgi:hypothetical protein